MHGAKLYVLLVPERGVPVSTFAVAPCAAANIDARLPVGKGQAHAHAQVDPTATPPSVAAGFRAVEQRQPEIAVAAQQLAVEHPAKVDAQAAGRAGGMLQAQGGGTA